ncbi:MAG: DMT family transporter, partial [Halanaerobium sp.]|nr:DMT family transporter [Halanaerobium sp.]
MEKEILEEEFFSKRWVVLLLAITACLLWGSAFPTLKLSYSYLQLDPEYIPDKIIFAGYRFFLASLLILTYSRSFLKKDIKVPRREWKDLIVIGIFQTALLYFFFYTGLAGTSGVKASILSSSSNFFIVLLAHFFLLDDRFNRYKLVGLICGFAGVLLINWSEGLKSWEFSLTGEGFILAGALVNAFGMVLAKKIVG